MKVSPSILAADFANLEKEILSVSNATYLHLDVMDGSFVPNITFGAPVIKKLRNVSPQIFDTHLMISNPLKYIKDFKNAGSDYITIHFEAVDNVKEAIEEIKKQHVKVGLSIKPNTSVKVLEPYLNDLDLILIMSVEPGFGGQMFLNSAVSKIEYLDEKRKEKKYHYLISCDGGINEETSQIVKNVGCDIIVCGSYLFNVSDRNNLIDRLEK